MRKTELLFSVLFFFFAAGKVWAHPETEVLESIFEDHGAIMLLIDPATGRIRSANMSARKFYGYSDLTSKKISDLNALSPAEIAAEMQNARDKKKNYFVFPHRLRDGSLRTVEVYSWPVLLNDQKLLFSVIHDITEKEEAQNKVLKYQERLEDLVKERTRQLEIRTLLFSAGAVLLLIIQSITILLLIRNIRSRKKIQSELNKTLISLHEQIEEAVTKVRNQEKIISEQNRRQSVMNLLVNLAHQWRQPLNTIGLMVQNLNPGPVNDAIMKEIQSLSDTISRFTELYEGRNEIESVNIHEAFSISAALIGRSGDSFRGSAEFINNISPDLNLNAVRIHIMEMFIQLIDNSLSIAESRGLLSPPVISVSSKKNSGNIIIQYRDNCGGFDPKILENIFIPYNTSGFRSRNKGLGLFQLNQIMTEYYNGSVRAENSSEGAVIFIKFPAETESLT